jgi:membrane-associated protease RseP (regulator of RpoE activity)
VAIAGPIVGGLASLVCYVIGKADGSDLFLALAYIGFLLNLINLIPIGILDGGAVWRSARYLYRGGGRAKAVFIYVLFAGTAVALAVGMVASHVPRGRVT